MENPYQSPSSNLGGPESFTSDGGVSPRALEIMSRTKMWVMIVGVLFCIMGVLTVVNALTTKVPTGGNAAVATGVRTGMIFGAVISFLLYVIPGMKLVNYSRRIGTLLQSRRSADLELALNQHRGFWKFVGVLTVILLVLGVIGLVAGLVAAGGVRG